MGSLKEENLETKRFEDRRISGCPGRRQSPGQLIEERQEE
jgi:hypothetical protein